MKKQDTELKRVSGNIANIIMEFYVLRRQYHNGTFYSWTLEEYVNSVRMMYHMPKTAPGSADRILRKLRDDNKLNYKVDRTKFLYKFLPVVEPVRRKLQL